MNRKHPYVPGPAEPAMCVYNPSDVLDETALIEACRRADTIAARVCFGLWMAAFAVAGAAFLGLLI